MPNTDNWLTQAFQDKPVRTANLDSLQDNIMTQVLSQPVDFLNERILAKRRRWGLLFAGSWLGLGLAVLVLVLLKGQAILEWLRPMFGGIYLVISQINLWQGDILQNIKLLFALKAPVLIIWQEYSWQITGMVVIVAVLIRGFWINTPMAQPKELK